MYGQRMLVIGGVAIALLGSGAGVAAGSGPARPALRSATPQTGRYFFTSSVLTVKSSSGARLHLSIEGSGFPGGTSTSLSVLLSTGSAFGPGETHNWQFMLSKTAVSYSAATGRGHITSKKKLGRFGVVSLKFTKTSQHLSKCTRGTPPNNIDIDVAGHLSGKVFFNTNSHWGSIGSRKHMTHFKGHSHLTKSGTGCPAGFNTTPLCSRDIVWDGPFVSGSNVSVFGDAVIAGKKSSTISVSNNVMLTKPTGASRSDYLIAREPAPTVHAKMLHITTSGKAVTGSATITQGKPTRSNYPCKIGGNSKTEKTKYYSGTWTSTGLTGHFRATGKLTPVATGSASFTVGTY